MDLNCILIFFCRLCATSFSLYCRYMFRPNRPSSDVQAVAMKDCAALCNAVLFSYVVASDYFRLCELTICFNFGVLEHRGFW
jgi:hypothetical protein